MNIHPSFENVGFQISSGWRGLQFSIAKDLKQRFNSKVYLYFDSLAQTKLHEFLVKEGVADAVINCQRFKTAIMEERIDDNRVIERARNDEERYNVSFNEFAMGHSYLGRAYFTGSAIEMRIDRSLANTSYHQFLNATSEQIAFWDQEIKDKNLTLIQSWDQHAQAAARHYGVPFRAIETSRFEDYWFWACDLRTTNPLLEKELKVVEKVEEFDLTQPYGYYRGQRKRIKEASVFWNQTRSLCRNTAMIFYHKIRYRRRGFRYRTWLRRFIRQIFDTKKLAKYPSLSSLKDKRFVFYPLHHEPETGLYLASPEFTNQIEAITAISRSLPADVFLVVKEHLKPIGRRPRDYYERICSLPNVVMLNCYDQGIEIVEAALATVTINGTSGFEAAIKGRPVISFCRSPMYAAMKHVKLISDMGNPLREALAAATDPEFDRERAKSEAAKFVAALRRTSFTFPFLGSDGKLTIMVEDQEVMSAATQKLLESIEAESLDNSV